MLSVKLAIARLESVKCEVGYRWSQKVDKNKDDVKLL